MIISLIFTDLFLDVIMIKCLSFRYSLPTQIFPFQAKFFSGQVQLYDPGRLKHVVIVSLQSSQSLAHSSISVGGKRRKEGIFICMLPKGDY